jgi:hypothetical protein
MVRGWLKKQSLAKCNFLFLNDGVKNTLASFFLSALQ